VILSTLVRRLGRGLPFGVILLLTFVSLVAGTTLVLTVEAYRSTLASLERDARARVRLVAEAREQMLTEVLMLRQQRLDGFLASAKQLCGEPAAGPLAAFSEDCLTTMVKQFRLTERADGARLTFKGRTIAAAGSPVEETVPIRGAIARVVPGPRGRPDFLLRGVLDDAVLTVAFDTSDVVRLFADRSGLGRTGEVFLTDAEGRFLTPARYGSGEPRPVGADITEPLDACRASAREVVTMDYRGVTTIHGIRPVSVIGGGCVDAHISHDEALQPAEAQRAELILRGMQFTLVGALLSMLLARRISAPVRRLEKAARALQAGAFDAPVPVGGPNEMRTLGHAFREMAADLAQMVGREQAARREAEAANRSKDHFLAMLSHELRTPLNAILGWARMMSADARDVARVHRATGAIERSAESLRRLIDDLLDISRIVAGKLRLVRGATRISAVAEAALDAVRPQAAEKGVQLEATIESDPSLLVLGDPQRLQQVIWNLVWNAVKFTPEGGTVSVRVRRRGDDAEVAVSDTGIGIDKETLPHIFEWFRQEDEGSASPEAGLGLGLALVRQLVALHGGQVRAESEGRGHGATFIVTLPTTTAHRPPVPVPACPDSESALPSLRDIRVLCVDDDPDSREVVRAVLLRAGAQVHTAAGAEEARRHLRTWRPHVLVFDIAMPQEDGYALMQSLRATAVTLPAIALTAFARREDAERARMAGFQVHMTKPIDPERLVRTVAVLAGVEPDQRRAS
jgi:signal transduction histidine kinase/ActR/RegA family two-component response regulator